MRRHYGQTLWQENSRQTMKRREPKQARTVNTRSEEHRWRRSGARQTTTHRWHTWGRKWDLKWEEGSTGRDRPWRLLVLRCSSINLWCHKRTPIPYYDQLQYTESDAGSAHLSRLLFVLIQTHRCFNKAGSCKQRADCTVTVLLVLGD